MKLVSRIRCGILLGLLLLLSACQPDRINFIGDGRVLRGVYEGIGTTEWTEIPADSRTLPIRLDVVPAYVNQAGYTVTGTVRLGDAEPIPFEGEVSGGDTQIYVLMQPVETPTFDIRFEYEGEQWRLYGSYWGEDRSGRRVPWYVSFGPDEDFGGPYQADLVPVQ